MLQDPEAHAGRLRAVSVGDTVHTNVDWAELRSQQPTPGINLTLPSPHTSNHLLIDTSLPTSRVPTPDLLALPTLRTHPNLSRPSPTSSEPTTPLIGALPHLTVPDGGSETSSLRVFESPRALSPRSGSPPASIRLPPPSIDNVSLPTMSGPPQWRTVSYWPYSYLPAPQLISATLFPTLRGWADKTWIEKTLALIALLPVFLLTITLPVVESPDPSPPPPRADTPVVVLPEADTTPSGIGPKEWNRWLVCVQCVTAPVFMMVMFVYDPESPRDIVKPILYSLVVGLVCLGGLIVTTETERAPKWRWALCFAGFAVSIGWISGVANEVVGVLKAFGVILGISDAILGLTIFAVVGILFGVHRLSLEHFPPTYSLVRS